MISGHVRISLVGRTADEMPGLLSWLSVLPTGVTVDIVVGVTPVDPHACRLIREHADRLNVVLKGHPRSVPRWLDEITIPLSEVV